MEELFAINFNNTCFAHAHIQFLQNGEYPIYHHGNISRSYINGWELGMFFRTLGNDEVMNDINKCIINIEPDFFVYIQEMPNEPPLIESILDGLSIDEMNSTDKYHCLVQNTSNIWYNNISLPNAWHLDLLDEMMDQQYKYVNQSNNLVDIWILDTGVNPDHQEFHIGQVIDVDLNYTKINLTHPHGTGTAACASGIHYGSSKNFTIYNYPVCRLGGSCANSEVDKGLNIVYEHVKKHKGKRRSVINMSIGSILGVNPINSTLGQYYNNLFKNITEEGGIVVVAAGNANQDACLGYYSFSPYVISVGAINQFYNRSSFSNYGPCVDLYSFGSNVPTAYSISNNGLIQYKSGTSFSSPIVAGIIANLLYHNSSLSLEDIPRILFDKVNDLIVAKFECGHQDIQCCMGKNPNTRQDQYCKKFNLNECKSPCIIKKCRRFKKKQNI